MLARNYQAILRTHSRAVEVDAAMGRRNQNVPLVDADLWNAVVAGDEASWRELMSRYKGLVYRVLLDMHLSMADAADGFQQTWILLYEHRNQIHDPAKLPSWLITTARRLALRQLQRERRFLGEEALDLEVSPLPLPDEEYACLERQARLESAIRQIDSRCQKLVEAFFYSPEDQSYEEIARSFGLSPNTLGPMRVRCLKRLREVLLRNGYLHERIEG